MQGVHDRGVDGEMMRMEAERARDESQRALQQAEQDRQQLMLERNNAAGRVQGGVEP